MVATRILTNSSDTTIRLSTEVPLPSLVRATLQEAGSRLLDRHRHRFNAAELHLHVKRAGSGLGCMAYLATDEGKYHAHAEEWDVRRCVERVLDALDLQVIKAFDRRSTLAGVF